MSLDPKSLAGALAGALNNVTDPADFALAKVLNSSNPDDAYSSELIEALAASPEQAQFDARRKLINKFGKDFKYRGPGAWDSRIKEARLALTTTVERPKIPGMIKTESGAPKPLLANAISALRHAPEWAGVLSFDEFAMKVSAAQKPPILATAGKWTDQYDRLTADWLQHRDIHVGVREAGQAVQAVARSSATHHPVREYLESLVWDGQRRIHEWLELYLGVEVPEPDDRLALYVSSVSAAWLISAVARIFQPGCKADCCLILEGEQGIKKSTAIKTIAGSEWYTDEIADFGSKDAALQMQGAWIIELAELDTLGRSDIGRVKSFMSRSTDRFRLPYGSHVEEFPRQCVFAGSVNESTYLKDETGARRFWPVRCTRIRIPELKRDRDQLWAEAVHEYRAGALWYLQGEAVLAAQEEQAARYEADSWHDTIADWVRNPRPRVGMTADSEFISKVGECIAVRDVLGHCIGKPTGQWTRSDEVRVVKTLKAIGMERFRTHHEGRPWAYRFHAKMRRDL